MLYQKNTIWIQRSKEFIQKGNIFILVSLPAFIGMIIFFGGAFVSQKIFTNIEPLKLTAIFGCIGGIIMGFSGLIQIYRREMPGIYMGSVIRGWYPVITGILWVIFCWASSLLGLFFVFTEK